MSRHLRDAIEKLKQSVVHMAGVVEERLHEAVLALKLRDRQLAEHVVREDREVDQMEIDVEEECLKVLALHQPVATDLRFIIAILKINNDLERIADLAVNLAERACGLAAGPPVAVPFDLEQMSDLALRMLKSSLDALVEMDAGAARCVADIDDAVDAINAEAYVTVQERIRTSPNHIGQLIQYLSCAKHLERIADLATNISEDVIYLVEGEIVRHRQTRLPPRDRPDG